MRVRFLALVLSLLAVAAVPARAQECRGGAVLRTASECVLIRDGATVVTPAMRGDVAGSIAADGDSVEVDLQIVPDEIAFVRDGEEFFTVIYLLEWAHAPGASFYHVDGFYIDQAEIRDLSRTGLQQFGPRNDYPKTIEASPGNLIYFAVFVSTELPATEPERSDRMQSTRDLALEFTRPESHPWAMYASRFGAFDAEVVFDPSTVTVGDTFEARVVTVHPRLGSIDDVQPLGALAITGDGQVRVESGPTPPTLPSVAQAVPDTLVYTLVAEEAGTVTVGATLTGVYSRYYPDVIESQSRCGEPGRSACTLVIEPAELPFTWRQDDIPTYRLRFQGPVTTSDGVAIVDWRWRFGDGVEGTGRNEVHRYEDHGPVEVTLTVQEAGGTETSVTRSVNVERFGVILEDDGSVDLVPGPDGPLQLTAANLPARVLPLATVGQAVAGCGGNGVVLEGSPDVLFEGRPVARVGDDVYVGSDSHGCVACPHVVRGPIIEGSATLRVDGLPAAVIGGGAVTTGCCGPSTATLEPDVAPVLAPLDVMESHTRPPGSPDGQETSQLNAVVEGLGGTVAPTTTLMVTAQPGDVRLEVTGQEGFAVGDTILLLGADQCVERATVTGFGSILLDAPLTRAHDAATRVLKVSPALFEGVPVATEVGTLAPALGLRAYPNPSAGAPVTLPYEVGKAGWVRLTVVDALGREVAVVVDAERSTGTYAATLRSALAPGVYIVRLTAGEDVATRVLTVAR